MAALVVSGVGPAVSTTTAAPDPRLVAQPHDGRAARWLTAGSSDERGKTSVTSTDRGSRLTWVSPKPLPYVDAAPVFRVDDRVLGLPSVGADRRTLTLPVDSRADIDPADLQVWLGARRLDAKSAPFQVEPGKAPAAEVPGRRLASDPGRRGALDTATVDYKTEALSWPEFDRPMEVWGHSVLPVGVDDAPLVVFLHGRHSPCYRAPGPTRDPICRGPSGPIPSYLGYDYLQQMLASQGYATVSVSANVINADDFNSPDGGARARSALVRHHLGLLADWSADPNRFGWFGKLDLDRVVLVGHSRGGEGVNTAAIESRNSAPYTLAGQVLIAPTDFGWQTAGYTPTSVFLPTCDGDVFDLQGQRFVDAAQTLTTDDTSLRSSILMRGTNHNFFNTEWTPGISEAPSNDDWFGNKDKVCGTETPERLSAAEQRRVARTYVGASVHAFVNRTQSAVNVIDTAGAVTPPGVADARVWTHAIGGNRTTVRPDVRATLLNSAQPCASVYGSTAVVDGTRLPACGLGSRYARQMHWSSGNAFFGSPVVALVARFGAIKQLSFVATDVNQVGGLRVDPSLAGGQPNARLDLRVIPFPLHGSARFSIRLGDGTRTWTSPAVSLTPMPGGSMISPLWAQTVRIDLSTATIDTGQIRSVQLVSRSTETRVVVLDVSLRRPGLAAIPDRNVPTLRLGRVTVREGDGPGPGTAQLPYTVEGDVSRPMTFAVSIDQSTFDNFPAPLVRRVTVPAGTSAGTIAVPFERDNVDESRLKSQAVTAASLSGVTVVDGDGEVVVRDDEPDVTVSWTLQQSPVRPGGQLVFRLALSAPRDDFMMRRISGVVSPGVEQISTRDIPLAWRRDHLRDPERVRPLAAAIQRSFVTLFVDAGETTDTYAIPTIRQRLSSAKAMTLRLRGGLSATVRLR